ncbi:glyoxalase [Mucilaginibacter conchicola]|uniref:Glyoxalase n=1 Tax=Mucilaginibacter conchicola TaxID=2303333 RepID=A0A372NN83_9SPHI|nr:VOC family protein [Mucilaginibacter conchicola]RFZ90391.1 glyoxalase [Mucilaginibacter conchicola]
MKTTTIWANMAVKDLERTSKFYNAIGFKPNGDYNSDTLTSFLVGNDNFVIHFFTEEHLKQGMAGELSDLTKGNEIVFTLGVPDRAKADEWAVEIRNAGGTMVTEPVEFAPGYYGFVFADPDGHKFNVFYCKDLEEK